MPISLIVTTRNEARSLTRLLDSIRAQTRAPDEIVVVDGGSTDGTVALLHARADQLPLTIISQPGANISQGRNTAIRAATGQVICSTDAGVRLDPNWIAEITQPWCETAAAAPDVVAGFFLPDPHGVFETALAATTLPALTDVRPGTFFPSSRSIAFRKSAWVAVNGYPEWLDYCEDLVFDYALRAKGCRFAFAPRAVVYFRPRETLRAFFVQYYHYARGDGKANLWFKRHLLRYVTYLMGLPLGVALLATAPLPAAALWIAAALVMFYTPYKRLFPMLQSLTWPERVLAAAWVPVMRITGDVAKMIGYPVGVWWRLGQRRLGQVPPS